MNETTLMVGNIIGYILQTIYLSYFIILNQCLTKMK